VGIPDWNYWFHGWVAVHTAGMREVYLVFRFTRHWIHYGFLAHTVVCVVVAAFEGLMGR
jgi:hypothetical protein